MSKPITLRRSTRKHEEKQLRAMIAPSEHQSQSMLFQWCALNALNFPELAVMFAIPNFAGFHGSEDARMRSGARAKREGRKAGVPDICLPVSRGPYHALYIEMKKPSRYETSGQKTWHAALRHQGNSVAVCHSVDEAIATITNYLRLPVLFAKPANSTGDFVAR